MKPRQTVPDRGGSNTVSTMSNRQKRRIRRDRRRERRTVHANPHVHRLLRFLTRRVLLAFFRVEIRHKQLIANAQGPLVLLGNHSSVIDPFITGIFVNKPIHFVVSDSQFRSRFLSWLLGLAGSIPKTKVMSDLDTVKKIVAVKSAGGVIGIFPEGQSSWDGHRLPIVRATDKLIKSLKIPVYIARIEGAYLSWPRWARRPRRGRIRITFHKLFEGDELKSLPLASVSAELEKALTVDAFSYQRETRRHYRGSRLAEYLERVLFVCPNCEGINTLTSHRRRLRCDACGYAVVYTNEGVFEARRGALRFRTVREWNVWQMEWFADYLHRMQLETEGALPSYAADDTPRPLLTEPEVILREGYKTQPLKDLGRATMALFPDRLTMTLTDRSVITVPLSSLEGINVQNNEHLEFYADMNLYRISTVSPRGNTFKWDYAVRLLQGRELTNAVRAPGAPGAPDAPGSLAASGAPGGT
jgi:1-acyl-sn-glycerol-3-phosphate acyltransferase